MNKRMHRVIFSVGVGMCVALASACGEQSAGGGTANSEPLVKTEPAKPPSDRGDQVVTGGDLAFMMDAAPGGMAEVELGRLAARQATNAEVKQFAERMITDHTKAGEELKQLAQQKKVVLPQELNPTHRETMATLSKLKGAEFDKEYVKEMVTDHVKDVTAFESAAKGAVDKDVKDFAAKTLPTLTEHLQMIREIESKMNGTAKP